MRTPFSLVAILALSFFSFLFTSCAEQEKPEMPQKSTDAEVEAIIRQQVDSLYEVYARFDYDWIDFYADEFTCIYPNFPATKRTPDSLRVQWGKIYDKYEVKLVSRGEPTIIASGDMALSYNSFHEILIKKGTTDTIKSVGTYIVAWKRQPDDSWKITFETTHQD